MLIVIGYIFMLVVTMKVAGSVFESDTPGFPFLCGIFWPITLPLLLALAGAAHIAHSVNEWLKSIPVYPPEEPAQPWK